MTKEEIIEKIGMREFNEAIEGLKAGLPKKNDVILVASRWKGLERDITRGTLSRDYEERTKNQIAYALMELAERLPDDVDIKVTGGGGGTPPPKKKDGPATVFISYNHRDKEIANRMRDFLEKENIKVTIDSKVMKSGEDIKKFIDRSIRDADVTLSLVSKNSLLSAWVGTETEKTLVGEGIADKKFIPVAISHEFFELSFVRKAVISIDEKIAELDHEVTELRKLNIGFEHLQNDLTRYRDLRNDLPKIVQRLKESLTEDISGDKFEGGMNRVVRTIKNP